MAWSNGKVDEAGNPIVNEGAGTVVEVKFKDGEPLFVLDGGKEITTGNISSILGAKEAAASNQATENPFAQASQLIGQTVSYQSAEESIQAIIEAITTNNGAIEYILNDGSRLSKEQFELVTGK